MPLCDTMGDEIMAGGRPSVYETKIKPKLHIINILRASGTEYTEIAQLLGVSIRTIHQHKADIEEFSHSIKNGNDKLILSLEKNLYSLAQGTYKQVRTKTVYDSQGGVRTKEVTEEYGKPELGALIFALTNIASDTWKNKREETISFDEEDITPTFADVVKRKHEEDTQ
jgi:hypothetical protein